MNRFKRQILVLALAACLLMVPALTSPAMVAHESQHAHHKAATHSSSICAWFCGAGQGFDLADPVFVPSIAVLTVLHVESTRQVDDIASIPFLSRGPPDIRR